jgi:integrase
MSVRKRTWKNRNGEISEAWVVTYTDQHGKRHLQTFKSKKDAVAYEAAVKVDVRKGLHTPHSDSITVREAGERWLRNCEADGHERATLNEYRRHLELHIAPYLGPVKLSKLTAPMIDIFRDKLRDGVPAPGEKIGRKRSPAMVRRIICDLGAILGDAFAAGLVATNVAKGGGKRRTNKAAQKRRLEIGRDIPTPAEIKAIIAALPEGHRRRPLLLTAIFSGLRASELRGLRWVDVDLDRAVLHVRQRADRFNMIGEPKSKAGTRTIPLPPVVVSTLRTWRLACPKGPLGLVFPNGAGNIDNLANMTSRGLWPAQIAAGVCVVMKDADGKVLLDAAGEPVRRAKYMGMHALRHWFASWCINRRKDGGLELTPKATQERLGHSSIVLTLDVYGHLFPRGDDAEELAAAQRALLG